MSRAPRKKGLLTLWTRVLPSNREDVFNGFVNMFILQRAQDSPVSGHWSCAYSIINSAAMNIFVRSGIPPRAPTPRDGFPGGEPGIGTLEGAVAGWGGFNQQSAWDAARGQLLPAQEAFFTCREGELHLLVHNLQGDEVVLLVEAAVIQQQRVPLLSGKPWGQNTSHNE